MSFGSETTKTAARAAVLVGRDRLPLPHARDAGGAAVGAAADADADEGAFEGEAGAEEVQGLGAGVLAGEALLGALAGGLGAFFVDLVDALGGVGEDGDLVVDDLDEAAVDGDGSMVSPGTTASISP